MSDMIQRCPYTPVTALLMHELKQEMLASWPHAHRPGHAESAVASCHKGPFVTFGASLILDAVRLNPSLSHFARHV
jgi:hypothetical protein